MKKISEIDKNFSVSVDIPMEDTDFYNISDNDFCIFGLIYDTKFRRMPENVANEINEGVYALHANTSGGRFKFVTDSPYIALVVKMPAIEVFPHMPKTGSSSFDIYADGMFKDIFISPIDMNDGYSGICYVGDGTKKEYTINFPLYNDVNEVLIGLRKGCVFEPPKPFTLNKKILFYGSSITQGGCVTRPGLAYPNIIANKFGCDIVNLGFSGSARGELKMVDYIVSVEHDIFVMDYDHNAPTVEHLFETHERFFKYYRTFCPDTPVIILSAPNTKFGGEEWKKRRDIVEATYESAVASGDKNVYFIDGETLWGEHWDSCTVDCIHPNDLGHIEMAEKTAEVIKRLI